MAVDYGSVRIGYSISDKTNMISGASTTIKNDGSAADYIIDVCRAESVTNIIVGLPLNRNGEEGEMCNLVRSFGDKLDARSTDGAIRVEYCDESFTTRNSHEILKEANLSRARRKKVVDGLAAKILLQKYLDDFNARMKRL